VAAALGFEVVMSQTPEIIVNKRQQGF